MRIAVLAMLVALALTPLIRQAAGADAGDRLRTQIQEAQRKDDAAGAGILLGLLNQALTNAAAQHGNEGALREWEELANDGQDAIAKLRSPEAEQVFVKFFPNMPPNILAILALALKSHAPNKTIDETAVKVLDQIRDMQATVACLELVGAHKVVAAIEPIVRNHLKVSNPIGVQVAAVRALGTIGDKGAVAPLISFLDRLRGGRLRFETNAALMALTGEKFNPDASTWRAWWEKNEAQFSANGINPEWNYELKEKRDDEVTYHEIPIVENRIVFVFDTSGSMQMGGSPNRMDKNRTELKSLIQQLNEKMLFNLILFSSNVRVWQKQPALVQANETNKKAAIAFLDEARPMGGTMTMSAMEDALREIALMNGVETVYLLTDGCPNPMRHSNVRSLAELPKGIHAIQRRIRFINQTLKVRINTIGVYTRVGGDPPEADQAEMRKFLEDVAAENDGVYKEVP